MTDQWERQPNETIEAWTAFQHYRDDTDPTTKAFTRNCIKVAAQLGKSEQLIYRWYQRWDWSARCAGWDAEMDREYRSSLLRERSRIGRRHAQIASSVQAIGLAGMGELASRIAAMSPRDVLDFVKLSIDYESRLYGLGANAEDAPAGVRIFIEPGIVPEGAVLPEVPKQ